VGVLVGADRDDRGFRLAELRVEDVRHLGDDALHVGDVSLAVEAVDGLELREVRLRTEFEREVLKFAVRGLPVERSLVGVETEREEREEVVLGVVVDLVPRQSAGGVGLEVRDERVGVGALLLVPDELVEHHLVADVGSPVGMNPESAANGSSSRIASRTGR